MKSRNLRFDNIRGFAFVLLFIAHTMINSLWYNIREFDVPLMVFVSGMVYSSKQFDFSWTWAWNRFLRLYVPVIIFLTIFFFICFMFDLKSYSFQDVVASYLMVGGVGYLWIFRIFMYIMILTPFMLWCSKMINTGRNLLIVTILTLVVQELLFWIIGINQPIVRITLYYAIGYALVFVWGLNSEKVIGRGAWVLLVLIALMPLFYKYSADCTSWLGSGERAWYNLEHEKYPPHANYLIYGIVCSALIYMISLKMKICQNRIPVITFLGQNTCWIYLWHIVFLNILTSYSFFNASHWTLRFVMLLTASTIVFYIQYNIVMGLKKTNINFKILDYLIG